MSSKGKIIGTKAETAVVKAARTRGFPFADRHVMKGAKDEGDVWLCPGVIIEVKGGESARSASDNQIDLWLNEAIVERRHAKAQIGFLVVQKRAVGEANAHRWTAVTTSGTIAILEGAGDGGLLPDPDDGVMVRLAFEDMLALLRNAGWGDPDGG